MRNFPLLVLNLRFASLKAALSLLFVRRAFLRADLTVAFAMAGAADNAGWHARSAKVRARSASMPFSIKA